METLPLTKVCDHCGTEFRRNKRQNKSWWTRARYCSDGCARMAKKVMPKFCPSCGVEFIPTHGQSRGQTFCSISCANRSRGINPVTTRYARMKSIDGKCKTVQRAMMEAKMGTVLPPEIVVHHKDEDKLNNQFSNFDLMTNSAHARMHTLRRYAELRGKN